MVNEVFNVDCVEYMRTLPDKFFDIAVCDPPYGDAGSGGYSVNERFGECFAVVPNPAKATAIHTQGGTWAAKYRQPEVNHAYGGRFERYNQEEALGGEKLQRVKWDIAPGQEFFDELFRVSRNQIIWGGNYFWLPPTRCFLIWRKLSISEKFSMAMCEYAWTSFDGNAKLFEATPQRGSNSGKFHPTEKPIALYNWILRNFAKEGDKVFDPMMGSQSSRCAAYLSGFDYYGCELNEFYFAKGNEFFERICRGKLKAGEQSTIVQNSLF